MTKTEYREYLASPHWQQLRKQEISRTPFCLHCFIPRWLAQIVYDQDLHVHHRNYAHLGSEGVWDLAVLCRRCHELATFGRSDLKAPHSHNCPTCRAVTFDPYREECDACTEARVDGFRLPAGLMRVTQPHLHAELWETAVIEIADVVGINALLLLLCDIERHRQQADEVAA